jgi:cell division protein FtsQ
LIVVAAVLVLLAGVAYAGLGTSLLGVSRLEIRGAGFVSASDIRAAAAVRAGEPLLALDTGDVAQRVEGLIGVAHADVSRHLPSTVIIDVRLRTPVAAAPVGSSYRLVDAGGVAFRTVGSVPAGVMVVNLADPGPHDPSTRAALAVLASLPPSLRDRVDRISARTPVEIQLMLGGGREIVWGDATDNATKVRVALSLVDRSGIVIDVSAPNVVTVH